MPCSFKTKVSAHGGYRFLQGHKRVILLNGKCGRAAVYVAQCAFLSYFLCGEQSPNCEGEMPRSIPQDLEVVATIKASRHSDNQDLAENTYGTKLFRSLRRAPLTRFDNTVIWGKGNNAVLRSNPRGA
jgi:hypothetical protein